MEIISASQLALITMAGHTLLGNDGSVFKQSAETSEVDRGEDEAAFSKHLDEKHKAVRILLDYLAETVHNRQAWLNGDTYSPDEKLKLLLLRRVSLLSNHPQFVIAILSFPRVTDGQCYEGVSVTEIMDKEREQLLAVILEGRTQGVFLNSVEPDRLVDVVMGAQWRLMYQWRASGFSFDVNCESNRIMESFLTLIMR